MRQTVTSLLSWLAGGVSSVVSFVFGAFRKMPVRVGLAIVGSIYLTIAFAVGLLWGYIAPSLLADDLQQTAQNSLSGVLVMILIWISIATFIPSAERQTNTHQVEPEAEKTPVPTGPIPEVIEITATVYDDEPDLGE